MTTINAKKRSAIKPTTISALIAGLPLMFLVGLFVGYQLWGQTEAAGSNEIPIADDDPVLGRADAPVTIIEFSDYECPYCQRYHAETFSQILATYGDQIRYVFKDLPLTSIHANAVPAANAAHCAHEQNAFWEFHNLLFSMQLGLNNDAYLAYADALNLDRASFEECLNEGRYERSIMQDIKILTDRNVQLSTPTFFINGQYLAGAQPFSVFAQIIEAELEKAN
ncbi:MAG TPA: thioredoxin domain-containing protein [Anaerolineales bacterium]|nr:thioredoxin domain-containing protein [Anaerolineales bacterium]